MRRSFNCWAVLGMILAGWTASSAMADVKLPKIFGDHMVLQQKSEVAVWGWADAGEEVTVSLGETKATAKADAAGKWSTKIATPGAGGPHTLTAKGKNVVEFKDVLIGEVWICSGQSNMEWTVNNSNNPAEEKKAGSHPNIRMFKVAHQVSATPQQDFAGGDWKQCSPETVGDFSAVGYFFARHLQKELNVPIGMINTSWGGTICEAWASHESLTQDPDYKPILDRAANFAPNNPNQASVLYNGMVHPFVPYGIRGAIWYQGESNVGRAVQYRKLFPAMIADWRKQFGQGNFPFLFVQLAPYNYNPANIELPEQWESQLKTLSVPNTGMCVTTDITDLKDIHPRNKQDVGKRLALWALANTYEKTGLVFSGPLYESSKVEGNKIRVKFKHVGGGLVAEGGKPLSNFTIAGEDKKFVEAKATIDGDSIVVEGEGVANPVAVRFAWHGSALPNFFNKEGLPASPFRTDEFPLTTINNK